MTTSNTLVFALQASDNKHPDFLLECKEWNEGHFRSVNKFYKRQKHKGSASGNERVFVIQETSNKHTELSNDETNDPAIVAAVRLVPYEGFYWLRSLYVEKTIQGTGVGSQLLAFVNQHILQTIHCFPYTHLDKFYRQSGYELTDFDQLPLPLQSLYERYNRKGDSILIMSHLRKNQE